MEDTNLTIAKIAHEIRNPLTLINSSLQLIETMHPEVKDFQFWSQTLDDVEYLNQLLDELSLYMNRPLSSRQVKKEKLRHEGLVPVSKGSQAL